MSEMRGSPFVFEACVDSAADAEAAQLGGADRVELCNGLAVGGITPSVGAVRLARERLTIPIMMMIRPRPGDFLYTADEIDVMRRDIDVAKELGVWGVVFGALTEEGRVDRARTAALVEHARPLEVTFHRAFDVAADPHDALETLIDLGVERVLTSGQEASVTQGVRLIASLVEAAAGRIVVMPGCGLKRHNVRQVVELTGARELHFTADAVRESPMTHRNERCAMGAAALPGEYERHVTDPDRVRSFIGALR